MEPQSGNIIVNPACRPITWPPQCLRSSISAFHLLVCALNPIVKDANGDTSSYKNYRGIAISSLILKVFDNCLLILFGSLLSNDDLQFGFQRACSTVQCTWAVQETISNYLRRGSEVYCCLLDFSKAFDKVKFNQLFRKLLDRSFPIIFLRLLLYIYQKQSCVIRWNTVESSSFAVKNGVRQGAILSPSLFCVYLDTLLTKLWRRLPPRRVNLWWF